MEDIKKYAVKGHIPTVNEGIEEGRLLVHCKDCKYSVDNEYCLFSTADMGEINKMDADDFCSRGERVE